MPKWGLTEKQIRSKPWGIASRLLRPLKTITDPVHGDIYINTLEGRFLDSPPLQRLRRVRQLGTTHLVYPGATHSRLSHALGAVRSAQDLLDAVIDNRSGPRGGAPDLFDDWDKDEWDHNLAEVTVLARLGALLHDIAHVPYGHTVEDDLEILTPHDENPARFKQMWSQLPKDLRDVLDATEDPFLDDLRVLILSKDKDGNAHDASNMRYPFVADIVGNTICADLLDYLVRDHLFAGLPVAFGDRFADDFFVSSSAEVHYPKRMVVRITRDGHERTDIVTELLKYLRYRYELSERVLTHHAKLSADAMIGKLLEMWRDAAFVEEAEVEPAVTGLAGLHRKDVGDLRVAIRELPNGADLEAAIDERARQRLEDEFVTRGDDGLLEWLAEWGAAGAVVGDGRRAAVGSLAQNVLNRRLFKPIGRADSDHERALADSLHKRFGGRDERRRLEEAAARFAGLKERWEVVIWLPSPKMRLKVAEVLVQKDGHISPLDKVGNERAEEIYASHRGLWAISVFVHPGVADHDKKIEAILAFLGRELGVQFHRRDGGPVRSVTALAVDHVADSRKLPRRQVLRLRKAVAKAEEDMGEGLLAAHSGSAAATLADLERRVEQIGIAGSLIEPRS